MTKPRHQKAARSLRSGFSPTPERKNQLGGVVKEVVDRDFHDRVLIERYKAAFECLLDYYLLINKITEPEHCVGMEFRNAYQRAVLGIKVEDIGSGSHGSPDMAGVILCHSEKIVNAVYSVLSVPQKEVVITVCGHDERPKDKDNFQTFLRGLGVMVELKETGGDSGYK
jgi:hypothetical protein